MGEILTRWSIDGAVVAYFVTWIGVSISQRTSDTAGRNGLRIIWTLGACLLTLHIACAFHFYHHWSHNAAYADTAARTKLLIGWSFGGGVWFNYFFTIAWWVDVAFWWRNGRPQVPSAHRYYRFCWHGFMLLIVINGAIVFATGWIRWLSLLAVTVLFAIRWQTVRTPRQK